MIARRQLLSAAALGAGALFAPSIALATVATERRFVFIIQRGAADGLDILRPTGDPAFTALRGTLIGEAPAGIKLDAMFTLHPSLTEVGRMYARGQALSVHAIASPYRDRSHFDGQNVLETGGTQPYAVGDGWLNRLVAMLPRASHQAIAIAPTVPTALRGPIEVASFAPSALPHATDDLMTRVSALYDADPQLHPVWQAALEGRSLATTAAAHDPASIGRFAASYLTKPDGPRIAMLETLGWDTHIGQQARLAKQLKDLDAMLAAMRDGLGAAWATTTVLIATEFGRTAGVNGTGGTDHGTGSVAMLVGGAVDGGRVIADWPGLAPAALYQSRDLRPTASLDALIAGVTAQSMALDPERVRSRLFSLAAEKPMLGLIRA